MNRICQDASAAVARGSVGADLRRLDGVPGSIGQGPATRRFVEAVLGMARAGCAWRLVPDAVGSWNSLDRRFARWQEQGVWQALLDRLAADADHAWADARQHRGAGPCRRRRGKKTAGEQALGRPRGGFSSRLHAAGDARGNPLAFRPTAGRRAPRRKPCPCATAFARQTVIADQA